MTTLGTHMDITAVPGIDVAAVTAWLDEHVEGAVGPFTFDVIAGGHSNLTFRVTGSDGSRFVLRRPPLGHVLIHVQRNVVNDHGVPLRNCFSGVSRSS